MSTSIMPTVLLIDDNLDIRTSFANNLSKYEGFTVVTAENGEQGLNRFYETRPDCVVIDVRMPELDGLQLTRALRGDPDTAETPLIMLTALNQDTDRLAGVMSGIDQYLVKPVKPSDLAQVIREALSRSADAREHLREQHIRSLIKGDAANAV
jgi:DNA-binding response OmpR family regulator